MDASPLLSSLNAGEFSQRMEARIDTRRYPYASRICRNLLLLPQGGLTRRPGTRFVKEVKDSTANTILFPFTFSQDDAWVLEAGNAYFRFYRRQARVGLTSTATSVTNGTFTGNANGWTLGSGAAYSSNTVTIPDTGTAVQALTVAGGDQSKRHVLGFQIDGTGTVSLVVTSGAAATLASKTYAEGYHIIEFTPTDGTATLTFTGAKGTLSAMSMALDNVSICGTSLELSAPYATADLEQLRIFQAGDVVYILHPSYKPRKLVRYGTYTWSLYAITFADGPYLTPYNALATDIGIFDLASKQLIANPFFENGLVDWTDASGGNAHVFHSTSSGALFEDATGAGADIAKLRTTFDGSNDGSRFIMVFRGDSFVYGLKVGTALGGSTLVNVGLSTGWHVAAFTTVATTIYVEFYVPLSASYLSTIRPSLSACYVYGDRARLMTPSAATGSITVSAEGTTFTPFASTDVGRILRLGHPNLSGDVGHGGPGWGIITSFSSSTGVTMQAQRDLPTSATSEYWAFGAFGGEQGYPKCLGFFDGRLVIANTAGKPQTIWMSQSNDLENKRPDSFVNSVLVAEDDDAIALTLASKRIDPILWIASLENMILGTAGGIWVISSQSGTITPADNSTKLNSAVPCADLEMVQINQSAVFAESSKRELYEIGFSYEQQAYVPKLLTLAADHIFNSPVNQLAFQRRPNMTLWCPRDDGRAATMIYNREEEVLGWAQQIIGGTFSTGDAVVDHVAIIPGAADTSQVNDSDERDEVWFIIKRTINGSTKRYVEFIEKEFVGPLREDYTTEALWWTAMRASQKDAFYVDSGITYDSASTSTITGLTHLEGQTVKVWADGKPQADKTVSSGSITLDVAASVVQAGLSYTHRYMSLKLPYGASEGSAMCKVKAITGCGVVVIDTSSFEITAVDNDDAQGQVVHDLYTFDFRRGAPTNMTDSVPLYTGESHKTLDANMSTDPRLYIESDTPGPFTLIGLAPMIAGTDEP